MVVKCKALRSSLKVKNIKNILFYAIGFSFAFFFFLKKRLVCNRFLSFSAAAWHSGCSLTLVLFGFLQHKAGET